MKPGPWEHEDCQCPCENSYATNAISWSWQCATADRCTLSPQSTWVCKTTLMGWHADVR